MEASFESARSRERTTRCAKLLAQRSGTIRYLASDYVVDPTKNDRQFIGDKISNAYPKTTSLFQSCV